MTTIRDVAERAGVSLSTVSHVLNGTRFVEDKTAQRVREAIQALDYRPNTVARSLRSRETHTIGLIVPDNSNPFFADLARVIEDCGFAEGYTVILCNSDGSADKEATYLDVLLSKQVDGLILISSSDQVRALNQVLARRVPVVVVDRELGDTPVDQVMVDNEAGGYLAGRYLTQLGHQHIGCISGPSELTPSLRRIAGIRRALAEMNCTLADDAVVSGNFQYIGGEQAMAQLLSARPDLTAIFAANDLMAIGAVNAIRRAGRHVPADLSIVGFDDVWFAGLMWPSLTTIAQPMAEIGQKSVTLLLEQINSLNRPPAQLLLSPSLIIRESCQALPRRDAKT